MLLFMLLVIESSGLIITLKTPRPKCFHNNKVQKGMRIHGRFVTSGKGESNMMVSITANMRLSNVISSAKESEINYIANVDGRYSVCFQSTDQNEKSVSFELHYESETRKTIKEHDLAKDEHIEAVMTEVKNIQTNLFSVLFNQQSQSQRYQAHRKVIRGTEARLAWCGYIKIVLVIIVGIIDIAALVLIFRKRDRILI